MMHMSNMTYDNSMSANPGRDGPPYWPQTMDHTFAWTCQNDECPQMAHPGIWEIPLNQFYGDFVPTLNGHKRSAMIRAAMSLNSTQESTEALLFNNFQRAYRSNRAPYVLSINADFLFLLEDEAVVGALQTFIRKLTVEFKDVWFVTMQQLIDWLRNPQPLSAMAAQPYVQCSQTQTDMRMRRMPQVCATGNKCSFKTPDLNSNEHSLVTCKADCPKHYPWVGNVHGQ